MNSLYLLRGPPGAGKTTLAKSLTSYNWSADMWFQEFNGGVFSPGSISTAHTWCREQVRARMVTAKRFQAMGDEPEPIAVHNTFIELWETKPYLDLAAQFGYQAFVLIVDQAHQNVHSVPEDKVLSMAKRFQFNGRTLGA